MFEIEVEIAVVWVVVVARTRRDEGRCLEGCLRLVLLHWLLVLCNVATWAHLLKSHFRNMMLFDGFVTALMLHLRMDAFN